MKCTWMQCQNEAVNEIRNVQYNTVLGHNCEEHTPKPSPQRDKDYIITEVAP